MILLSIEQYQRFVKEFIFQGAFIFSNEARRKLTDTFYLYRRDPLGIFGNLGHPENVKIIFSLKNNSKVLK